MRWSRAISGAAAVLLCTQAAEAAGPIDISQPWAPPAQSGQDSAVFLTIDNEGGTPDTLLRVECVVSDDAAIVNAGGRTATVAVPAHGRVLMQPSGMHVVLRRLNQALPDGALLPCTATFEHAGERIMEVSVETQAPPAPGPI